MSFSFSSAFEAVLIEAVAEAMGPSQAFHRESALLAEGFYCDFNLDRPFVPDDLGRIAKVIRRLWKGEEGWRLLKFAGVHPDGDEEAAMVQRLYGTYWESKAELDAYMLRQDVALNRDHRKIGKELELFFFHETAPGMPYWLPNGLILLNQLIHWWRVVHDREDYQEISSPLINSKKLWEISGHWDHYRNDMFIMDMGQDVVYGVKPMNCPNAMIVFNQKLHSYRDLPLRLSDCDALHRHERSGALHGLLRVQKFQQDDAHIFVAEDGIEAEFEGILRLVDEFYRVFGLEYRFRLATRPADSIGDDALWSSAESVLHRVLQKQCGDAYEIADGDGAFYGPKIDILIKDAMGRDWQMGTIQLDYQIPRRFECQYIDKGGKKQYPVVIHRVIYGSLERFIGILLEHSSGMLPLWLAPVQLRVIGMKEQHQDYALLVVKALKKAGIRAQLEKSSGSMGRKIKQMRMDRVPYGLVIGDKEIESGRLSLRKRGSDDLIAIELDALVGKLKAEIDKKR